nr:MAG TPA: hypothetical protein [Bacteriophage sp.]
MAFLDETGLSTFKNQCDSHYLRLNGGSSMQTVESSNNVILGLKTTKSGAYIGTSISSSIYAPAIVMYGTDGVQCGEVTHSFRSDKASQLAFYASNKMSNGGALNGGFAVMRQYNVQSDTDGTTYWFSSKPNARTAIGIFSGTTAPTTNASRANGDIYIQY